MRLFGTVNISKSNQTRIIRLCFSFYLNVNRSRCPKKLTNYPWKLSMSASQENLLGSLVSKYSRSNYWHCHLLCWLLLMSWNQINYLVFQSGFSRKKRPKKKNEIVWVAIFNITIIHSWGWFIKKRILTNIWMVTRSINKLNWKFWWLEKRISYSYLQK